MKIIVCENYQEMSKKAAEIFAQTIQAKPNAVLGLSTGASPTGLYEELVNMNAAGEVDFSEITTFNLDEYYPIKRTHTQSYYHFMQEHLFSKVNINPNNIHMLNGETSNPEDECSAYEEQIEALGGIDLQVFGIGRNGHIGFNEPDVTLNTNTHLSQLTNNMIATKAQYFKELSEVPTTAMTMGIATILRSKKIVILASGKVKHKVVSALLDHNIDTKIPATMLKLHPNVTLICDKAAYSDASLGVDIGGTDIKLGVLKNDVIVEKKVIPTAKVDSAEALVDYIAKESADLIEKHAVTKVGVGVPGCIRNKRVSAVNLPFDDTPLAELFQKRFGMPTKMENDANCAAYGEAMLGEGKSYRNQIMITLGTGIGGGIIIHDKIYHGRGDAGEIGHIILEKDGRPCGCGQKGCFEAYGSAGALSRDAEAAAKENTNSVLYQLYEENDCKMNGRIVFAALDKKCPVAYHVFDRYLSYLADGITSMMRVFSPDAIVLSGGITAQGEKLLAPLKEKIALDVPIIVSGLRSDAGIVGAALL